MFGFVKRLFGGQVVPQINPDPFSRETKPLPAARPEPVPPPPVRAVPPAVLQRDELIDAATRIAGYRFSARRPESPTLADPAATIEILRTSNVAAFAERRLALIPIRVEDWLSFDYAPLIAPLTTFLLAAPNDAAGVAAWREVAAHMHAAGARVALDRIAAVNPDLLADNADYLLLDYSAYSLPGFEQTVKRLLASYPQAQLIVDNVSRWAEQRYCLSLGAAYCAGPFTTSQDDEQQAAEISQSRVVLIEMLNLLRRDAELAEITTVAKRDPGVVVKLVNMSNTPLLGLSQRLTGIDQAIMLLGREQLYRWVTIGMFRAGSGAPRDEVLLEMSLARGRFLELVGQGRHDKAKCDELFLLGLLSLLDCLLGVPMAKLLERIHLSEAIRAVLLTSSGPLGRYLMLAIAVEKGRPEHVQCLAEQLGIALGEIELASASALAWAEEAVSASL